MSVDRLDEAVVSCGDDGRELVVEQGVGRGVSHQPKVDHGEVVDVEGAEIVLDALAELCRSVVAEDSASVIAAGADFADQG
jgi:hypothetical protein